MTKPRSYNRGMPTYEYACLSCGHHVEVYQRFSDEPLTVCGVCGGPLRKVFFPAGILFKGSGFYSTDNRSAKSKAAKDADSGTPAASDSKPEGSKAEGSKAEGSKAEGSKAEGSKAEGKRDPAKPAKTKE